MRARRSASQRPTRPGPVCEDCGAELWWAWGVHGKVWTPLSPFRLPMSSSEGTYEVWRDQHGGLLCVYRAPGERGQQEQSWRAAHHNVLCGSWRFEAARALVREVEAVVGSLDGAQLHELDRALGDLRGLVASRAARLEQLDAEEAR